MYVFVNLLQASSAETTVEEEEEEEGGDTSMVETSAAGPSAVDTSHAGSSAVDTSQVDTSAVESSTVETSQTDNVSSLLLDMPFVALTVQICIPSNPTLSTLQPTVYRMEIILPHHTHSGAGN